MSIESAETVFSSTRIDLGGMNRIKLVMQTSQFVRFLVGWGLGYVKKKRPKTAMPKPQLRSSGSKAEDKLSRRREIEDRRQRKFKKEYEIKGTNKRVNPNRVRVRGNARLLLDQGDVVESSKPMSVKEIQ